MSLFDITLRGTQSVRGLKVCVQNTDGHLWYLHTLYTEDGEWLNNDNATVSTPCNVWAVKYDEPRWNPNPGIVLSQNDRRITNQIGDDIIMCATTDKPMDPKTGQHYITFKHNVLRGEILFGVVQVGVPCAGPECNDIFNIQSTHASGWSIRDDGALQGIDKCDFNCGNPFITESDVLTLCLDTNVGSLHFWVNGRPCPAGYPNGVRGSLRWAVSMCMNGDTVTIIPTPQLIPRPP